MVLLEGATQKQGNGNHDECASLADLLAGQDFIAGNCWAVRMTFVHGAALSPSNSSS